MRRALPPRISAASEQLKWAQSAETAIRSRVGAFTAAAAASAENPIASSAVWRSNVAMMEEGIDFDASVDVESEAAKSHGCEFS